jgi:hypothetical protein
LIISLPPPDILASVSFEAARLASSDAFAVLREDLRQDYGEDRFVLLGMVQERLLAMPGCLTVLSIFSWPQADNGGLVYPVSGGDSSRKSWRFGISI